MTAQARDQIRFTCAVWSREAVSQSDPTRSPRHQSVWNSRDSTMGVASSSKLSKSVSGAMMASVKT